VSYPINSLKKSCGADAHVRAGPPGPAASGAEDLAYIPKHFCFGEWADEGVGRGPGGPPHRTHYCIGFLGHDTSDTRIRKRTT